MDNPAAREEFAERAEGFGRLLPAAAPAEASSDSALDPHWLGLIRKYGGPAPRYTSYPTALQFGPAVDAEVYRAWLAAIAPGTRLSLYFHVPYCRELCWFCGCHTKATHQYQPVQTYLKALENELATVAALVSRDAQVESIHWGGGSPTILEPAEMEALQRATRAAFSFAPQVEFSVEIDPRTCSADKVAAMSRIGVTRASLGIQDFNEDVQASINRFQSFAQTEAVVKALREHGISSINLDLVYGLPKQTRDSLRETLEQVLTLDPDRLALFGYAHVPWMKSHQKMIPESALPDVHARFAQANDAAALLAAAGYQRIGIDHFARREDGLAQAAERGAVRRNFQGYTTDDADVILGFGASAIGQLPQGFVQNIAPIADYERRVNAGALAVNRGYRLTAQDQARGFAIQRLMCDFSLDTNAFRDAFGEEAEPVIADLALLDECIGDGLVAVDAETVTITPTGRPFVRAICARLDPYHVAAEKRHSAGV